MLYNGERGGEEGEKGGGGRERDRKTEREREREREREWRERDRKRKEEKIYNLHQLSDNYMIITCPVVTATS